MGLINILIIYTNLDLQLQFLNNIEKRNTK